MAETRMKWFRMTGIFFLLVTAFTGLFDVCQASAPSSAEMMLDGILRSAPTGIGVVENRVIVRVNDYIVNLTGYSREELIGKNARIFYPSEEDYQFVGKEKYRQIAEYGTGSVETRWRHKNGNKLNVILSSTPLDTGDLSAGVVFTVLDISARKQAEQALRNREEWFFKIFNANPAPLVVSEIDTGRFIDVNARWIEMLGYSREEQIGRTSTEVGIWSDPSVRGRIVAKLSETGFFKDESVRFKTRTGEDRFALWSGEVITMDGREVLLSLLADETERRQAEASLHRRTQWFMMALAVFVIFQLGLIVWLFISLRQRNQVNRALKMKTDELDIFFSSALDLLCIASMDGRFIRVNREWENILGYRSDDLEKRTFLEFVHPEDMAATIEVMGRLEDRETILNFTNRYRCKDGSYRDIEWRSAPHGNLIYAAARDITERRLSEKNLAESRRMLISVIDTIPIRVFWKDLECRYLGCNRLFALDAGREDPESLVGEDDFGMGWSDQAEQYRADDFLVMKTGVSKVNYEESQTTPDGRRIWLRTSKIPLRDDNGTIYGILGTYEDITDRKQTEQIIDAKNKELEQIVYVASHDLRSPLVNVDGYGRELEFTIKEIEGMIEAGNSSAEAFEKTLREHLPDMMEALFHIRNSTRQMDALLKGLLMLSRSGRTSLTIEALDMNVLMARVLSSMEYQARQSGARLRAGDLPPCRGDAVQVTQVFVNLAGNALKFLEPKRPGIIEITGSVKKGWAVYCVEDNGIGIAPEHQKNIFELFHRLNPAGTEGEGLGLTIVRQILGRLDGDIQVDSLSGRGSRFYVSLPHAGTRSS